MPTLRPKEINNNWQFTDAALFIPHSTGPGGDLHVAQRPVRLGGKIRLKISYVTCSQHSAG